MKKLAERIYDENEAKALDRKAQMKILGQRDVKFSSKAKEDVLVKLIVESNPELEVVEEKKEPEPQKIVDGYILKVDFTKALRKGDVLSKEKYDEMKSRGINVECLV